MRITIEHRGRVYALRRSAAPSTGWQKKCGTCALQSACGRWFRSELGHAALKVCELGHGFRELKRKGEEK